MSFASLLASTKDASHSFGGSNQVFLLGFLLSFLFPFPLVLVVSAYFVAGSCNLFSDGYKCVSTFL